MEPRGPSAIPAWVGSNERFARSSIPMTTLVARGDVRARTAAWVEGLELAAGREHARDVSQASAAARMLRCNMTSAASLQFGLEDLLADLRYARRKDDLGRLALLAYCEVRRWARDAGDLALADHASHLITGSPHVSREAFLAEIDSLIHELEEAPILAGRARPETTPKQIQR